MANKDDLYLKKTIFVLLFCSVGFCFSVCGGEVVKGGGSNEFYYPVAFEKYHRLLLITEVKINGSSKFYRFIFDTGSSDCAVFGELANDLKIKSSEKHSVTDGTISCDIEYTKLDFQISGICFKNIQTDILENETDNFLCGIDGIIGANLIKKCAWEISSKGIHISNSIKNIDTDLYTMQKVKMGTVPIVSAAFGSQYGGNVLFDLGYAGFFAIHQNDIKYISKKDILLGCGSYFHTMMTDREIEKDTIRVFKPKYDFVFGEDTVYNSIIDVCCDSDLEMSLLGSQILDYYDVLLDFGKRRLYTKQRKKEYLSACYNSFGLRYSFVDRHVLISFIWDKSSAKNRGLKLGQEIEEVNGITISDINGSVCDCKYELGEMMEISDKIELKIKGVNDVVCLNRTPLF